jgi:hypothetical protein
MTMTYKLTFIIHELPKPVNRLSGNHWGLYKKYREYWHALVSHCVTGKKPKAPLKRAQLTLVRYSSVAPDYDGMVSSWKPVIDGLVKTGVLEDDSMAHIGIPRFEWEKAKPKAGKIFVGVEELDASKSANQPNKETPNG